mmetsp:Transcript_39308/g.77337  ORF Transcript_39308/g.77337 Transcript_39308/m.77337 type:complete len:719 (+) Transcript_39308:8-2164(+)
MVVTEVLLCGLVILGRAEELQGHMQPWGKHGVTPNRPNVQETWPNPADWATWANDVHLVRNAMQTWPTDWSEKNKILKKFGTCDGKSFSSETTKEYTVKSFLEFTKDTEASVFGMDAPVDMYQHLSPPSTLLCSHMLPALTRVHLLIKTPGEEVSRTQFRLLKGRAQVVCAVHGTTTLHSISTQDFPVPAKIKDNTLLKMDLNWCDFTAFKKLHTVPYTATTLQPKDCAYIPDNTFLATEKGGEGNTVISFQLDTAKAADGAQVCADKEQEQQSCFGEKHATPGCPAVTFAAVAHTMRHSFKIPAAHCSEKATKDISSPSDPSYMNQLAGKFKSILETQSKSLGLHVDATSNSEDKPDQTMSAAVKKKKDEESWKASINEYMDRFKKYTNPDKAIFKQTHTAKPPVLKRAWYTPLLHVSSDHYGVHAADLGNNLTKCILEVYAEWMEDNKASFYDSPEDDRSDIAHINDMFFNWQSEDYPGTEDEEIPLTNFEAMSLRKGCEGMAIINRIFKSAALDFMRNTGLVSKAIINEVIKVPVQAWATVHSLGMKHARHQHNAAAISGTYYVKLPENPSPISFFDTRGPSPPFANFFHVKPQVGDIVVFPGWLPHEVAPTTGTDPRISIAFNLQGSWSYTGALFEEEVISPLGKGPSTSWQRDTVDRKTFSVMDSTNDYDDLEFQAGEAQKQQSLKHALDIASEKRRLLKAAGKAQETQKEEL